MSDPLRLDSFVDRPRKTAAADVTVVSGLAIGIDAAAHEGALDVGGSVIGVVATGLDIVYPRRHRVLFDRVRPGLRERSRSVWVRATVCRDVALTRDEVDDDASEDDVERNEPRV